MENPKKDAGRAEPKQPTGASPQLPSPFPDQPIKHLFDPACECADCMSKRGGSFQYVRLIPNLPDGSAGIYTQGESPADAWPKHLHELELIRLGVGKGRVEGQQDLREEARAILQVQPEQSTRSEGNLYRPAKELLKTDGWPATYKQLRDALDAHPAIRRQQPLSKKTGKPIPNRLIVHLGDWMEYLEARKRGGGRLDPLDLPAEVVDQAIQEVARRKAEIDRRRATK